MGIHDNYQKIHISILPSRDFAGHKMIIKLLNNQNKHIYIYALSIGDFVKHETIIKTRQYKSKIFMHLYYPLGI